MKIREIKEKESKVKEIEKDKGESENKETETEEEFIEDDVEQFPEEDLEKTENEFGEDPLVTEEKLPSFSLEETVEREQIISPDAEKENKNPYERSSKTDIGDFYSKNTNNDLYISGTNNPYETTTNGNYFAETGDNNSSNFYGVSNNGENERVGEIRSERGSHLETEGIRGANDLGKRDREKYSTRER